MNYLVRQLPRTIVIRNGPTINLSRSKVFSYFALAYLLEDGWNVSKVDDDLITLSNKTESVSIACRYRASADVLELEELFLRSDYGSDFRGKIVLDIGMSNGNSSIFFARRGASRVIGLEPLPESFALALKNIAANSLSDTITALGLALSSTACEDELYLSLDGTNVSSLKPALSLSKHDFESKTAVTTTTLDALMGRFNLSGVDVLKLDCEGCEYDVIRSLSAPLLGKIKAVVMEFHDGPRDLPEILSKSGFSVECESRPVGYLRALKSDPTS